jgi:hypothetical protein
VAKDKDKDEQDAADQAAREEAEKAAQDQAEAAPEPEKDEQGRSTVKGPEHK